MMMIVMMMIMIMTDCDSEDDGNNKLPFHLPSSCMKPHAW